MLVKKTWNGSVQNVWYSFLSTRGSWWLHFILLKFSLVKFVLIYWNSFNGWIIIAGWARWTKENRSLHWLRGHIFFFVCILWAWWHNQALKPSQQVLPNCKTSVKIQTRGSPDSQCEPAEEPNMYWIRIFPIPLPSLTCRRNWNTRNTWTHLDHPPFLL